MSPLGQMPVEGAAGLVRSAKAAKAGNRPAMQRLDSRAMAVGWDRLVEAIGPEVSPVLLKQFRRYYYAGAKRLLTVLLYEAGLDEEQEPTVDDLSKVDAIQHEIDEFLGGIAAGLN